jgi:hypothetical protein
MDVYCNGTARVRHRETGQIVEIESDELDRNCGSRRPRARLTRQRSASKPILLYLTRTVRQTSSTASLRR